MNAEYSGGDFQRGAQAMREMLARFVEQGGDAVTAASIRANWHPGWDEDPGPPPDVIGTWEALECPEGEALYSEWRASVAGDDDHRPDLSPQGLSSTARMLERWALPMLPANRHGQVPFLRGLIESAIRDLRGVAIRDGGFLGPHIAQRIEAGTAETEGLGSREPGPAQQDAPQ